MTRYPLMGTSLSRIDIAGQFQNEHDQPIVPLPWLRELLVRVTVRTWDSTKSPTKETDFAEVRAGLADLPS